MWRARDALGSSPKGEVVHPAQQVMSSVSAVSSREDSRQMHQATIKVPTGGQFRETFPTRTPQTAEGAGETGSVNPSKEGAFAPCRLWTTGPSFLALPQNRPNVFCISYNTLCSALLRKEKHNIRALSTRLHAHRSLCPCANGTVSIPLRADLVRQLALLLRANPI